MLRSHFYGALFLLTFGFTSLYGGGAIIYEIGSQEVGLASAGWSARADEASTAFTNPAGMMRLPCPEAEVGLLPIYTSMHFEPNECTDVKGKKGHMSEWIPGGGAYYVQPINCNWAFGASVLGYFGSKLKMNSEWVGRYYFTKAQLQGYSFVPAMAYRFSSKFSVGVGAQVMYGVFKQESAINNSLDKLPDGKLKVYDDDVGFGCIAGFLYEVNPRARLGLQYVSQVKLHFNSRLHTYNVGPKLQKALVSNGLSNSRVLFDANVPQWLMFSVYLEVAPGFAIMANGGWQEWADFQKATVTLGSTNASVTAVPKYKNTWHWAFGARIQPLPELTCNAGIAYDTTAVNALNRPLDFPISGQWRYAAGFEWTLKSGINVGVQYTLLNQEKFSVDVDKGTLAGHVAGKYKNVLGQFFNLNVDWQF